MTDNRNSTGEQVTHSIVPALPGWYVAWFFPAGGQCDGKEWAAHLDLEPIIAWEIVRMDSPHRPSAKRPSWNRVVTHIVNPLTVRGNMHRVSNDCDWAIIKRPDGKFNIPGYDVTLSTEGEAVKEFEFQQQEQKELERRAREERKQQRAKASPMLLERFMLVPKRKPARAMTPSPAKMLSPLLLARDSVRAAVVNQKTKAC